MSTPPRDYPGIFVSYKKKTGVNATSTTDSEDEAAPEGSDCDSSTTARSDLFTWNPYQLPSFESEPLSEEEMIPAAAVHYQPAVEIRQHQQSPPPTPPQAWGYYPPPVVSHAPPPARRRGSGNLQENKWRLFVAGVSVVDSTDEELEHIFSEFGQIKKMWRPNSRQFMYVEYYTPEAAYLAKQRHRVQPLFLRGKMLDRVEDAESFDSSKPKRGRSAEYGAVNDTFEAYGYSSAQGQRYSAPQHWMHPDDVYMASNAQTTFPQYAYQQPANTWPPASQAHQEYYSGEYSGHSDANASFLYSSVPSCGGADFGSSAVACF